MRGHVNLVETLADRICDIAFADPRVARAKVRVEKTRAISATAAVGVEVGRFRQSGSIPYP
jgi:7,8-dihydroneopterin aldolase/epimerase/oxygenase